MVKTSLSNATSTEKHSPPSAAAVGASIGAVINPIAESATTQCNSKSHNVISSSNVQPPHFVRRICDFEKQATYVKSFIKQAELFVPTKGLRFGCADHSNVIKPWLGPHLKKSSSSETKKKYYLSARSTVFLYSCTEYFALEIFNYLGINTPKCRFSTLYARDSRVVVTKAIPNLIPMRTFYKSNNVGPWCAPDPKDLEQLMMWRDRYQINIDEQVIEDKKE